VLGGWLVQYASWRWVFFINVPLAAIALIVLFWRVPESRDEDAPRRLDWWGSPIVLSMLAIGIAALIAFLLVEARSSAPMVPLTLFRSPTFSGANLLTFLLYGALSGITYYLPFNFIQVQGYSPTFAGAAFVPCRVSQVAQAVTGPPFSRRWW